MEKQLLQFQEEKKTLTRIGTVSVGGKKYQGKWAAHSNGKEGTTLLFCCRRCRTGNGSENMLETTS